MVSTNETGQVRNTNSEVFKVNNFFLFLFLCVTLSFLGVCSFIILWLLPSEVPGAFDTLKTSPAQGVIYFAIMLAVLYFCLTCLPTFVGSLIFFPRQFFLRIEISDDNIKVSNRKGGVLIENHKIVHIIYDKPFQIIFIIHTRLGIRTLRLLSYVFRKDDFRRLLEHIELFPQYTNDIDKKTKLYKDYKVNNIFWMHHLEMKIDSLKPQRGNDSGSLKS
jgi:hypothetical protein